MKLRALNVVAVCVGLAMAAAPAMAQQQQRQGRGMRGGAGLSVLRLPPVLQTKLGLTEDQKKGFADTSAKLREEATAARQNGGGGPEAFQALREKQQKAEAEAEATLKPDQKSKFEAWKTEIKDYQGLGNSAVALLAIDLKADQKTLLKALSESTGAKRRELFQGAGQGADRQAMREKMTAMQAETDTAINNILTADQKPKFEEVKKSLPMPGRRAQQQ